MEMRGSSEDVTADRPAWLDFHHTARGTLAGRYMRLYWQPVFHTEDLPRGRAKPIKVMNQDYTLYRGEDGKPYLTQFRCPHRGAQLSAGMVEGNTIRCFYHGWTFDGTGACVHQPAEPRPFLDKVKIRTYPCQDYLGLVFAYLGDEQDAPAFPRYPQFEEFEGILELDSYYRGCNFFNNLENALDRTHSGFVHRNNPGSFDGVTNPPLISAQESIWGVTVSRRWSEQVSTSQVGMPNIFHHKAQPSDPEMAIYREFLAWWTPIDDYSHMQFTVAAVRMPPDKQQQYLERRKMRLAKRTQSSVELAEKLLSGEIYWDEIDRETTDYIRLQDHVAQIGQGVIADHDSDFLGQSDLGVALIRKLWARELKALAEGRPLKVWRYDAEELSTSRGELWEAIRAEQVQT